MAAMQPYPQYQTPFLGVLPPAPSLASVSLFAIDPPVQRSFMENDLVTIIISERSMAQRNQKLESKKNETIDAKVQAWIDTQKLIQAQLAQSNGGNLPAGIAVDSAQDYKGDGKYNREDTLTDRITARVLEVKPNGTLLLEARRSIKTDREEALVVISGICRPDDVTVSNTVQSNQMYDMRLDVQNTGDVKNTADKGLITRILEGMFNF